MLLKQTKSSLGKSAIKIAEEFALETQLNYEKKI
jgi:hypothetical protein